MKAYLRLLLFSLACSACPSGSKRAADAPASDQSCVDRWIADRDLDEFANPRGTVYSGGTPLFDERAGTTSRRLDWIYHHHPEIRAACSPSAR